MFINTTVVVNKGSMNTISLGIFNSTALQAATGNDVANIQKRSLPNRYKILSYSTCEHLWSYLGKIVLLIRSLLNIAIRNSYIIAAAGKNFPQTVKDTITRMKLFSIVSVPFSLVNLDSTVRKIFNSFLLNDREGMALSTLSFTIIAADVIDSVTTFINASLALSSANPIGIFSALGLPLGFTMSGLGTISRTIQVAKAANLYRNIDKEISVTSEQQDQMLEFQKNIQQHHAKKMKVDTLGIIANLFTLSALIFFTFGSVTALPHVLKSVSFSIRLGALYYQDQKM